MAAKKKAKAKKKKPSTPKAKKAVKKTVARKAKAPAKKVSKKKAPAKAAKKKTKKAAPGLIARTISAVKKAVTPAQKKTVKKKQLVGEGDYAASAKFDADQAGFVRRNKARIPEMGKAAEAALDGPEGDSLRDAEAVAAGHSRDTFGA